MCLNFTSFYLYVMKNTLLPNVANCADDCVNMRPDDERPLDCLVPALPPAVLAGRPWRVIGVYPDGGSGVIELMADGSTLGASVHGLADDAPEPYIVAEGLDGIVTGAYRCGDGFMILTSAAMYRAVFDDDSSMLRVRQRVDPSDYPVIITEVASETTLSMPVGSIKLSGSYSAQSVRLEADDAVRLSKALYDVYCQASSDATASGLFIAPVLCRYRLFDRYGNLLFESVPKLHVPTSRHDNSMTTTLVADVASGRVNAGSMAVPLYGVAVKIPEATGTVAERQVARVEVQLTPQLHRPDGRLSATHRLSGGSSLTATMPGCDSSGNATERFRRVVMNAVANCDSMFETVLVVDNPFEASTAERTISLKSIARSVDEECKITSKTSAYNRPLWLSRCRLPHSLTAGACRRDGEITLLGRLAITLFDGHPVEYFTNHGSLFDNVETVTTVTFSDGRRVVSHRGRFTYKSMKLSPVIVYPDADAVSVELQLCDSDGNNRYVKLPLRACGRFACYIDDSLSPIDMDAYKDVAEFHLPQASMTAVSYRGNIIVFTGDTPGDDVSGRETGSGDIVAIHPVARQSSTAWESSRSRYYVMGGNGTFSLAFNKSVMMMPVLLDSRPVTRPDAVVTASRRDKSACVYAIAGSDIISLDGNCVKTVVSDTGAAMLMWSSRHAELLAITPSTDADKPSSARVLHTRFDGWSTRLLPATDSCFCSPTVARLTSTAGNAVYDLGREVSSPVRCVYTAELRQRPRHIVRSIPFIDELTVDLTGENVDGSLTISGDHGRAPGRKFSVLYIDGTVNRPIVHHTLMPARYRVKATIDALLSPDSHLVDSFYIITHE